MDFICCYSTNQDNEDYLMVSVKEDFLKLLLLENIPKDIKELMSNMCYELARYELDQGLEYQKEKVALRKDSPLGSYILTHPEIFHNEEEDINYSKVVEAYQIALFDEKEKMCNKLGILFRGGFAENGENFSTIPANVCEYIKNHHDFWYHYHSRKGDYPFLVYEEGSYQRKVLKTSSCKEIIKR